MRRPSLHPTALACITFLAACAADPVAADAEALELIAFVDKADPVTASELPGTLTQASIRATHALPAAEFAAKWQASLQSPVLFLRAYPGAFHKDLKQVPTKKRLGGESLCVGDAHPGNFGWQRVAGKTRYVFDDLDDSGFCPTGWDAARYFAAVRVYFDDADLLDDVLEVYVDALKDPEATVAIDGEFKPDWDKVREGLMEGRVQGTKFVIGGELMAVTAGVRASLVAAVTKHAMMAGWTLDDVVALDRKSGGSGGLDRYWMLGHKGAARTLFEVKELAKPGTEFGTHGKTLLATARISQLKAAFWGDGSAEDDVEAAALGKRFLLRDRGARASVDVLELGGKDRLHVLKAQASVLAGLHRAAWQGVKKDMLRAWLHATSKVLAKRWIAAYAAAGGK
ncbi:MAG: DUF2252 domain-containing protein [Myxococcales bacterium]|nr:DUF2252 domain-containing protein [Myxococcales bacterium]